MGAELDVRKQRPRAIRRHKPGEQRRTARAPYRWLVLISACLLTFGLFTSAAYVALDWRLRQGPLAANFLTSRIETAIRSQVAPLVVKINGTALHYDSPDSRKIGLLLTGIDVNLPDGTPVANIRRAGIELDWFGLLAGAVSPVGLTLFEPHLKISYSEGKGLLVKPDGLSANAADSGRGTAADDTKLSSAARPVQQRTGRPDEDPVRLINMLIGGRNQANISRSLNELHIHDGVITVGDPGHDAQWRIPQFAFRLESRGGQNIVVGSGNAIAPSGPLNATFSTEKSGDAGDLRLTASVDHLVPADLAEFSPSLLPLAPAVLPISGDASLTLLADGTLSKLDLKIGLGKGHYAVSGACADSFRLDAGGLNIRYVRGTGKVELLPSDLASNGSSATVSGLAQVSKTLEGHDRWQYSVALNNVKLADTSAGLPPIATETWTAKGTFTPSTGETILEQLALRAGNASLALSGRIASSGLDIQAQVEAAETGLILRLWPVCFQNYARNWVIANVQSGRIGKGRGHLSLDANAIKQMRASGQAPDDAATAQFTVDDIAFSYADGLPPIIATHGEMTFAGRKFIAEMPDAASQMPSGRVLTLSNARYEVPNFLDPSPRGKISLQANGPIETGLEFLNLKPLNLISASGLRFTDLGGDFSGKAELELPVTRAPKTGELSVKATATLKQLRLNHPVGTYLLQGGTVELEASESALRADGDLLINGVAAKVLWSRPIGSAIGLPPPIRIAATLDANDREQLGLPVNTWLAGELPVTVDLAAGTDDGSGHTAHVEANLTNAELIFEALSWRKPQGETAGLAFDITPADKGRSRLTDVRLVGDKIAISGDVELGADHKVSAFHFPGFSLNVVTQLDVAGKLRADKVMEVVAKGRYFDGHDFFRSLFSPGQSAAKPSSASQQTAGLELTADIDTILGYSQTSLHGMHIHALRQQGQLTSLKASATLDGGHKVGIDLEHRTGQPRFLVASTDDFGRACKLLNLYQGVEDGNAVLKVNLDGEGAAEKIGTLWAKHFTLFGDPIVNEVLTEAAAPGGKQSKTPERPQFDFTKLRVEFSVGEGQLLLRDLLINGPVLGATMRGRIDFGRQTVQLSGTYIPLYGLNSWFGALPIFGPLLVGRSGEGLIGFTFGVEGPLSKPEVLVNPVSGVAPGIFRQIFEVGPDSPVIEQRRAPAAGASARSQGSLPGAEPDIGEPLPPMSADQAAEAPARQVR